MSNNNNDFLQTFIESFNLINKATPFFNSFVKNLNSQYVMVSKGFLELAAPDILKIDAQEDILDSDFEAKMLKNTSLFAETIRKQDKKIITNMQPYSFLHVHSASDVYIVHKCPIIDPNTQTIVGIIGYFENFVLPNILKILFNINGVKFGLINHEDNNAKLSYELTERQHMVLFLSAHKYSYTEIASVMRTLGYQISNSRVNAHLENLKYIFNVKTKEQLIEKAISLKYNTYIPRKFLKIGTYDLNDEMTVSPYEDI